MARTGKRFADPLGANEPDQVRPYKLAVTATQLRDLRRRIENTRWPQQPSGSGADDGIELQRVQELAQYWNDQYDWRKQERLLNQLPQFTTTLDGANVHFLHVRSPEPDALPVVMTLGWPSSSAEFARCVGPLTDPAAHGGDPRDAFHLVAPSIPGFALSGPLHEAGWTAQRVASSWAQLMDRLGYARYGAQGSDWGAVIAPELGRLARNKVVGVHVNALVLMPPDDPETLSKLSDAEKQRMESQQRYMATRLGYAQIQSTRPQTLAYGLLDSPVGQLAWHADLFDFFGSGDPRKTPIDRDEMLTTISIYWFTATSGSSARMYKESSATAFTPKERSGVPTGVAVFPGDNTIRAAAERSNNVVHWSEFDRGGHLASIQAPDLLVQDIRDFFRPLRR